VSSSEGPLRQTRRRLKRWMLLVLAAFVAALVLLAAVVLQSIRPPNAPKKTVEVNIRHGDTVREIAQVLQQHGLIRSAFAFRVYYYLEAHHAPFVSAEGRQVSLMAGAYQLQIGLSISQILQRLETGRIVSTTVSVTIPEGYTVKQIAARLAAQGICSAQAFLTAEQKDAFTEPFLSSLSEGPDVKHRLEGYLFPDTYDFSKGSTAHAVIDRMLQDFQNHVGGGVQQDITAEHRTLSNVITEASLIEKEAKVGSERPLIASVISNRLRIHMALQIDATIEYVLGHQNIVTTADAKVQDPYNTYVNPGLPPGPIASPGMASIEAALHPQTTDYLYYVVKNDGTGESYFASTYAEQLHNEQLSQENLKNATGSHG